MWDVGKHWIFAQNKYFVNDITRFLVIFQMRGLSALEFDGYLGHYIQKCISLGSKYTGLIGG